MNIRAATTEDREAILALVPRLTQHGTPPGRDARQIAATDLQAIAAAIDARTAETHLLVAEHADSIVGFIHVKTVTDYYTQRPVGHISDIVVASQAEGRGVGRALIAAAEDWARSRGYALMQLNVLVGNTAARSLYEHLGYAAEWLKYVKPLS
jgi:ribosomal protein S18 acetylase RimI-like enzyme